MQKNTRMLALNCALLCMLPIISTAQQPAAPPELTARPSRINVSVTRGEMETRSILLAADGAITQLKFIPLDLLSAGERAVIPASAITLQAESNQISAGDSLQVKIEFNLGDAPSGEFSGELYVQHQGGKLSIPVTVKVKDQPVWPLVVLVAGILVSLSVSWYREAGKPRDESLVRVAQLRAQMREDNRLAAPFRARIDAFLLEVDAALVLRKWDDARKALEEAENIMLRWRKGRGDWIAQLGYADEFEELLKKAEDQAGPNSNAHLRAVRRGIEDALRLSPDRTGPDALRDQLDKLAEQLKRYIELRNQLQEIVALVEQLPEGQRPAWREKTSGWLWRLENILPADEVDYGQLKAEVEAGIKEVKAIPRPQAAADVTAKSFFGGELILLDLIAPSPFAGSLSIDEEAARAERKLRWYVWALIALVALLLAWVGFIESYIGKPTFGANGLSDYFVLFAWGFGAEATRASIIGVARQWDLVWIK